MFKVKDGVRVGATDVIDSSGNLLTTAANATLLNSQPGSFYQNASNLSAGTILAARMPALTGDITTSAGALATTLATVNSNVGSFGSATAAPTFTVNAKGLITAAGSVTITPAFSSITSKPTTLSGYGITDAQPLHPQLTSLSGSAWSSGSQVVTLSAANTVTLVTVGSASGNILNKAAGDALYLGIAATASNAALLNGQPASYYTNASNLASGTVPATQMPALTGDITTSAGGVATTLATVNSNTGSFGSTTAVPIITVNAKGLITAVSTATLGTAAVAATGTSGHTVPFLDGANTWSGSQTFSAGLTVAPTAANGYALIRAGSGFTASIIDLTANNLTSWGQLYATTTGTLYTSNSHTFQTGSSSIFVANATGLFVNGTVSATNFSGSSSGTNTGDQTTITGNAGSATVLQTGRTIGISGAVTGTATSFNGSANITIPITAMDMSSATTGTLAVARGGTGTTTSTGSGSVVLSAGPSLTGTTTVSTLTGTTAIGVGSTSNVSILASGTGFINSSTIAALTWTMSGSTFMAMGYNNSGNFSISGAYNTGISYPLWQPAPITNNTFSHIFGVGSGGTMLTIEYTGNVYPGNDNLQTLGTSAKRWSTIYGVTGTFSGNVTGANLSGTNTGDQTITLTGDLTGTGTGSFATTLATVNSNVGSFGSTSAVPIITVNAKGLITAVSTAALGTAAVANTGTSGANVPLLNGTNTWSGTQTYSTGLAISNGSVTQTISSAPTIKGTVSNTTTLAGALNVLVSGRYAYVGVSSQWGLSIVDFANPSAPTVVGNIQDITNLNGAFGMAMSGKYVFVAANGTTRVTAVDVSNPYAPVVASSISDSTYISFPRGLAIAGKYAYVASGDTNRISVLDISNPYAMTVAGALQDNTNLVGTDGIFISGKYLYTAAKGANLVSILDISDPVNPVMVSNTGADITNTNNVHEVYVVGKYLYAVAQGSNSLSIFDVSNPAVPVRMSTISNSTTISAPKHLYVAGQYAYVTSNGGNRLTVIDVSNPSSPTVVSSLQDSTNLSQARGIFISGKYALVAGNNKLNVIDLDGFNAPVGSFGNLQTETISTNNNAHIGGNIIAGGTLNIAGGIRSDGGISASGSNNANSASVADFRSANGSLIFLARNDGRVGIGQSAPAYKLDVNGTLGVTGNATITGSISASNFSGTNTGDQTITLTGDITGTGTGSFAATLATVNSNTGSFGSTTAVPIITVNGKGLITAVSTATLGTAAVAATGTSGHTVPFLDGTNTWSGPQTMSAATGVAAGISISADGGTKTGLVQVDAAGNLVLRNSTAGSLYLDSYLGTVIIRNGSAGFTTAATFSGNGLTVPGTISASNFSGSSSGTNTGDQTTITGNAGTATTLQTGRTLAITGDLAWTSPSFNGSTNVTAAGTLATVNSNVGSFGSTTAVPIITVNGKGLITAVSTATLGTAAVTATGTSGHTVPFLDGTNTWSGLQSLKAGVSIYNGVANPVSNASTSQILLGYAGFPNYQHAIVTRHNAGGAVGNGLDVYLWTTADVSTNPPSTKVMSLDYSGMTISTPGSSSNASLTLGGTTNNWVNFGTNGVGAPTFTTRSVGTKLVLSPLIGASAADYGFGIESSTLWSGVPTTGETFKWYGGTTLAASLTGAGALSTTDKITTGNGMAISNGSVTQTYSSTAPTIKGTISNSSTLPGAVGVVASGRYAYVAVSSQWGVSVIDFSIPSSPVVVGNYQDIVNLNGAFNLALSGKFLFVTANGTNKVTAIDVSNPYAPAFVSTISDATYLASPRGITVVGKYAFIGATGNNRVTVLDISNPYAMTIVGSVQDSTYLFGVDGVTVSGKYLYASAKDSNLVSIYDISTPTTPTFVGNTANDAINMANCHETYVIGKYLYAVSQGSNALNVFDVSNPASPTRIGGVSNSTTLSAAKHLYVAGQYAYVTANGSNRLTIVDVSNPASPTVVSSLLDSTNLNTPRGIFISGKYALVAATSKFNVIDLDGFSAPVGSFANLQTETLSINNHAYIGGNIIATGGLNLGGGIKTDGSLSAQSISRGANTVFDAGNLTFGTGLTYANSVLTGSSSGPSLGKMMVVSSGMFLN